jgi:hypothetical protein
MKVYLATSHTATNMYTAATLRHMAALAGVQMAAVPQDAEAVWVSVCDPDDLPVLVEARRVAGSRPVVMGGFEAFFGVPYLAWADYVVVGEGWTFIEAWGRKPADALALPCVLTRERSATANYAVAYDRMPLVRLPSSSAASGRFYYLAGRGCGRKCAFCATSWCMPHTSNGRVGAVVCMVEARPGRNRLTLITNDSSETPASRVVTAQSVRVADYLRAPHRYRAPMLHFGIEGWTEDARRRLGKPLADDDIRALLDVTREQRQQCELFMIVGYPGWDPSDVRAFAETAVPLDASAGPRVWVKATYFDPCPHTPLSRVPVGGQWWDQRDCFTQLNSRNKRIRVFPTRSTARSAWRTCLHRATPDEAVRLGPQPRDVNDAGSYQRLVGRLDQGGLGHLLAAQEREPCTRVAVSYRPDQNSAG